MSQYSQYSYKVFSNIQPYYQANIHEYNIAWQMKIHHADWSNKCCSPWYFLTVYQHNNWNSSIIMPARTWYRLPHVLPSALHCWIKMKWIIFGVRVQLTSLALRLTTSKYTYSFGIEQDWASVHMYQPRKSCLPAIHIQYHTPININKAMCVRSANELVIPDAMFYRTNTSLLIHRLSTTHTHTHTPLHSHPTNKNTKYK